MKRPRKILADMFYSCAEEEILRLAKILKADPAWLDQRAEAFYYIYGTFAIHMDSDRDTQMAQACEMIREFQNADKEQRKAIAHVLLVSPLWLDEAIEDAGRYL